MDLELRSVLLIVGVVVIAAILIHGLIGIRKASKPVDISHIDLNETDEDGNLLRDGSGFDRHGVGVVRKKESQTVEKTHPASALPEEPVANVQETLEREEVQLDLGLGEPQSTSEENQGINFSVALEDEPKSVEGPQISIDPLDEQEASPVFDSPVIQEKEDFLEPKITAEPVQQESEIITETVDNTDVKEPQSHAPQPAEPMDVLVLNVIAGDNQELGGAILLPTLLTLGLKFGDMDIFHRHEKATGKGDILFSLVNMVKPGTFDIDNMEQFSTTGISLFMTIPHQHGNMETFNMMLNAAAKIAEAFDGQVLDGDRSTLTKQSTQHYVQRIREVERKMLLVK